MPAIIPAITAALVAAGVAETVATIIANVIAMVLSMAISMGVSALLKSKPDKRAISNRRQDLQSTVKEPAHPRDMIFGRVKRGGVLHFYDSVNSDMELMMGVIVAGHEVEAIDEIYNYDELMIDQFGVVQPKFKGWVEFEKHLGTEDQTASSLLIGNFPGYMASDRLQGIAHVVFKFFFNGDVFDKIPSPTFVIRGAKLFDPRDSSTEYSPNAALAVAHWLNHPIYGLDAPYTTEIDTDLLIDAANACDEDVAIMAGQTLEFDGVSNVIDMGTVLDLVGDVTIEARVSPGVVTVAGMGVLEKDTGAAGWALQVEQDKVRFITRGLSNVTLDTGSELAVDTWTHIAAVWDSVAGTKKIYVDGVLSNTASGVTGTLASSAANLKIGRAFEGRIQDVRLWSEPRAAVSISAYAYKSLVGREDNLEGYWKLDEKVGLRAEDSVQIHDGTITGAVWVDDDSVLGSEKKYEANGLIFSDQPPREVFEDLLTSLVGTCAYSGGKWLIRAAGYETPTVSFGPNDYVDSLKVQARRSRRDLFNSVRGTFISPKNLWQSADFPPITNATFVSEDGGDKIWQDIELPFTTSSSMAQRTAFMHLLRNREQVSCSIVVTLAGLRVRAGDVVYLNDDGLGWIDKAFEVISWQFTQVGQGDTPGLGIAMDLRETNAAIYDFNPATDEVPMDPSPDTHLFNPFVSAVVSDLVDRIGYEAISEIKGEWDWSKGTAHGLVFNPWTGHMNPQDRTPANENNFDLFNTFVVDPVPDAYFESNEVDIDFVDLVRTYILTSFSVGPGIINAVGVIKLYDFRTGLNAGGFSGGFDPGAFYPGAFSTARFNTAEEYTGWKKIVRDVSAEGRFFKHRIQFTFTPTSCGTLKSFDVVIDKKRVEQKGTAVVLPAGGQDVVFDQRYHLSPSMSWGYRGGGVKTVSFSEVRTTQFTWIAFDRNADTVDGIFDWQAVGV
jgi:hypothetical protein